MAHWVETAAIVVTAAGTLILAFATFKAVRTGDVTAKAAEVTAEAAERSLRLQLRPVLAPTRDNDGPQSVVFQDGHPLSVPAGMAVIEEEGDDLYMAIALRNVGVGLAVLYGWHFSTGLAKQETEPAAPDAFEPQYRGLYVAPKDTGFWQARPPDGLRPDIRRALGNPEGMTFDLLYGDEEGGQGRISRFHLRPRNTPDGTTELSCEVASHWRLDGLSSEWQRRDGSLRLRPTAANRDRRN